MTNSNPKIPNVAVIGCGKMGRFHAKTYANMPLVKLVGVFDVQQTSAAAVAREFNTQPFTNLDELLKVVDAVTIATPTQFHLATAQQVLQRKIPCLIEKPLAKNSAECQQILQWSREFKTLVQVGHIERFNPAMRAIQDVIKSQNFHPRFIEAIRLSPMTFRSLDVGVVLDMMIHDIDLVLTLANSPIARIDASGTSVTGMSEDICNTRITFENGCVANITASRLALKTERKMRLYCEGAYITADFGTRSAMLVNATATSSTIRDIAQKVTSGEIKDTSQIKYVDLIKLEPLPTQQVDQLTAQAASFIQAIQTDTAAEVTAEAGAAAVETAERIVAAMGK